MNYWCLEPFSPGLITARVRLLCYSELTKSINDIPLKTHDEHVISCVCASGVLCVSEDVFLQVWGGCLTVRVELSSTGLCLAETSETQKAEEGESWMALPWYLIGLTLRYALHTISHSLFLSHWLALNPVLRNALQNSLKSLYSTWL